MKATWLYYDYLRRYGILILLGLVIGAAFGFVFHQTQPDRTIYVAQAHIGSLPNFGFLMITRAHQNPQEAVDDILYAVKYLESAGSKDYIIKDFEVSARYRSVLWKTMAIGSVVGCLVAIGAGYVWQDALTYQRRRREGGLDVL